MDYYDKMIDDKKKTISFLKEYLEGCQKKVKSLKRETELIKEDLELVQFEIDNLDAILKDYNEAPKKIKIIKDVSNIYSIMISVLAAIVIFAGLKLPVALNVLFSILLGLCSFILMNGWSRLLTKRFYNVRQKYDLLELEQSLSKKKKQKTHLLMLQNNYQNCFNLSQNEFEQLKQFLEETSKELRVLENYDALAQENIAKRNDKIKKLTKEK